MHPVVRYRWCASCGVRACPDGMDTCVQCAAKLTARGNPMLATQPIVYNADCHESASPWARWSKEDRADLHLCFHCHNLQEAALTTSGWTPTLLRTP